VQVLAAGGIVFDVRRRLLLIRRAHEPAAGTWSIPGGRCRRGEDPAAACVREVAEETGLQVVVQGFAGRVVRAGPAGVTYLIEDYVCTAVRGRMVAGDDAAAVAWCSRREMRTLPLAEGLWEALRDWRLLPD
jgi:8-oxo-dGTP diphosphatase